MTERDYEDAEYLGFVMRIYSTYAGNVAVYSRNGIILANLATVPQARRFIQEQRRVERIPANDVGTDPHAMIQALQERVNARG